MNAIPAKSDNGRTAPDRIISLEIVKVVSESSELKPGKVYTVVAAASYVYTDYHGGTGGSTDEKDAVDLLSLSDE